MGAGRIGSTVASNLIKRNLGDILLIDVIEGLPQGEALDLGHMAASYGIDVTIRGTNDYKDIAGSNIVIVTSGVSRKQDMTRLDLLQKNSQIIGDVSRKISEYAVGSKVLMVTNPLDIMTYVAFKVTGFQRNQVLGMGGILDSARYRCLISKLLRVPRSSVKAFVIGEHGESMLPLSRYSTVEGKPLTEIMSYDDINRVMEETRNVATEVISLKGSTMHAPASAVAEMVEIILKDKKKVLPVSTYLDGEYGVRDLCIGVLAILGRNGVEEIKELQLNKDERMIFMNGVEKLRGVISRFNV